MPSSFQQLTAEVQKTQFLDRNGEPLNISYRNYWNVHDEIALHDVPELLQKMFITAEDKNFEKHSGVDWKARFAALIQNIKNRKVVRGASTLTEQVIRMIHPRSRTVFSKTVEGVDAWRLEQKFSKADILEFYLNQVPYASNRRGIKQASKYYFSKPPDKLSIREMTALVVLVRAPTSFDMYRYPERIDKRISAQLKQFYEQGVISKEEFETAEKQKIKLSRPSLNISAEHFLDYIHETQPLTGRAVMTTLDGHLHEKIKRITRHRIKELSHRQVANAAVLILDRRTGEVLAWVSEDISGDASSFDAVRVLRQPASSQKPFLYALALTKGWTAATVIKDAPFTRPVGHGIHHFKNYSRSHYGDVTLREALGNSLNIPALKTIEFVGMQEYLLFLKNIGFEHLNQGADFYQQGLALGNAEVSLFELTRAYLMLANAGMMIPVRVNEDAFVPSPKRVLPETVATLIGNILSDPIARQLEFGFDSILNFPVQTAVKTGTSTDFRDAWAMGYNADFVVGIWMGNLNYEPMSDVTGAVGPAFLLRSVFAELNRRQVSGGLYLSPDLVVKHINGRDEFFDPSIPEVSAPEEDNIILLSPADGLMLAIDPRLPRSAQSYLFALRSVPEDSKILWVINDKEKDITDSPSFFWNIEKGHHKVRAEVTLPDGMVVRTDEHAFTVH